MSFWPLLYRAVRTPAVNHAIRNLYADLDQAVAQHGPTCWASGRCCDFNTFGHRLFVTGLEVMWVLETHQTWKKSRPRPDPQPEGLDLTTEAGCPFQVQRLCTIHRIRPMGCRIFFCQQGTDRWQGPLYEQFLAKLRALHDQHGVPYRYLEWRVGLVEAVRFCQSADSNVPF